jgi:hypothetical protein
MKNLVAKVYFEKRVQEDNFDNGCELQSWITLSENLNIEFKDTDDFKSKLADWSSSWFGIDEDEFLKYVSNEVDNNRFDYSQNEDSNGNSIVLTKERPNGYLCDYTFCVNEVLERVDYKF